MRIYEEIVAHHKVELNNKIADFHAQYPVVYGVVQGQPYRFTNDEGESMWAVKMGRFRSAD